MDMPVGLKMPARAHGVAGVPSSRLVVDVQAMLLPGVRPLTSTRTRTRSPCCLKLAWPLVAEPLRCCSWCRRPGTSRPDNAGREQQDADARCGMERNRMAGLLRCFGVSMQWVARRNLHQPNILCRYRLRAVPRIISEQLPNARPCPIPLAIATSSRSPTTLTACCGSGGRRCLHLTDMVGRYTFANHALLLQL